MRKVSVLLSCGKLHSATQDTHTCYAISCILVDLVNTCGVGEAKVAEQTPTLCCSTLCWLVVFIMLAGHDAPASLTLPHTT